MQELKRHLSNDEESLESGRLTPVASLRSFGQTPDNSTSAFPFYDTLKVADFSSSDLSWDINSLLFCIANAEDPDETKAWLTSHDRKVVQQDIAEYVGLSPLFQAVTRNCPETFKFLVEYGGANVDAVEPKHEIPVLAYAIMHSHLMLRNDIEVARTLLSLGAKIDVIPPDMWTNYTRKLRPDLPANAPVSPSAAWCTPSLGKVLAQALNISMRHLLHTSWGQPRRPPKAAAIATLHKMPSTMTAPYRIIGQKIAYRSLSKALGEDEYKRARETFRFPVCWTFGTWKDDYGGTDRCFARSQYVHNQGY